MSSFIVSGFADEIDANFEIQLKGLKKLGIDYIEIRGVDGKNVSDLSPAEVKEVKEKLGYYGVKVSAIGSPIGKIKITDAFAPHLDRFKAVLETAFALESKYIRIFSFFMPAGHDPAQYRGEVLERLQKLLDAAAGSGVTLLHENEKEIYGDTPERCLDVLKSLSGGLGATFDPANFIQCGCEVYPSAYDLLRPYIAYVHIKDALESGEVVPAGKGVGKVEEVLKSLYLSGYEGFLSLEPHLGSFTGLSGLENTGIADKLPKSGFDKFEIAYHALKTILNNIEGGI